MIEQMECDGLVRTAYRTGTSEFDRVVESLKERFGPVDTSNWYSVSTPQYNSIFDDEIVSMVYAAVPPYLHYMDIGAAGRKYFLKKGWVYDKSYEFIRPGTGHLPCPAGSQSMYVGKLVNVFGQPGDSNLTRYECLYFSNTDHAAVEAWAEQALPQGKFSTFYSATFDTKANNRLMRMKTYVYDEENELFSNWARTYARHCKARGV